MLGTLCLSVSCTSLLSRATNVTVSFVDFQSMLGGSPRACHGIRGNVEEKKSITSGEPNDAASIENTTARIEDPSTNLTSRRCTALPEEGLAAK
jgi:hypothetical protein